MSSNISAGIDINSRHIPLKGPEKFLPHLPLRLCLRVSLLVCDAQSKSALVDDGIVHELVSFGVKGPRFLSKVELLGKSYAECLKSSHACHLATQVEQKVHLLDSDHQSWEALLLTVRGHRLKREKKMMHRSLYTYTCSWVMYIMWGGVA